MENEQNILMELFGCETSFIDFIAESILKHDIYYKTDIRDLKANGASEEKLLKIRNYFIEKHCAEQSVNITLKKKCVKALLKPIRKMLGFHRTAYIDCELNFSDMKTYKLKRLTLHYGNERENPEKYKKLVIYKSTVYESYVVSRHTTTGWQFWHPTKESDNEKLIDACTELFKVVNTKVNMMNSKARPKVDKYSKPMF